MQITKTSQASGITRTLDLPITEQQLLEYVQGTKVQIAFPNLTADQREFIFTGITAEEWAELFHSEGEE